MKIIVVGAGLAGLTGARDLVSSGAEVSVFEAQSRVGGRVLTSRAGFANEQFAELGAEVVYPTSTAQLALCAELDVELTALRVPEETQPVFFGGRFLEPSEARDLFAQLEQARSAHPPAESESAAAWAERLHLSQTLMTLISCINQYGPCLPLGELLATDLQQDSGAFVGYHQMVNGSSSLTTALSKGLDIHLDKPVRAIEYTTDGVLVHTSRGSHLADAVLIAVPGPLTTHIGFDPPLPSELVRALHELPYQAGARVVAQYEGIKEAESALASFMLTDGLPQWLFCPSASQAGDTTIVSGTIGADLETSHMGEEGMLNAMDFTVSQIVGRPLQRIHGEVHSWTHDPYSRIVVRVANQHERESIIPIIARPIQARVYFAGEHTDARIVSGGMEGAIRSGHRAAREILQDGQERTSLV